MRNEDKAEEQLIRELVELRQQIAGLKASEIEHKQAEEALGGREDKNRWLINDILDSTKVGIFILDSTFRIVCLNQALERYFGIRRAEVVGKDKRKLIKEQIKNIFADPDRFAEKVLATYDNNTYVENFECHVLPDGEREELWLEHWSQPIQSGPYAGGRIEHYTDITERKRAEEELKKTKDYLDNIIQSSLDCIAISDSKGYITKVNQFFLETLDYKEEEVTGKNIAEFGPREEGRYKSTTGELVKIDKNYFTDLEKINSRLFEKGKIFNMESYLMRKNKEIVPVETSLSCLYNEVGDIIGAVAILRDITERKKTEEEKARIETRLKDKVTELSITNKISEVLLSTRELDEILHMILIGATAYQALGFNRAFLFLINGEETMLEGKIATGSLSAEEAYRIWERLAQESLTLKELLESRHGELSKEDEPINNLVKQMKIPLKGIESIFTQAVYEKKSFNIVDGIHNPLIDKNFIELLGTDAFALVPLISRGKPLGVLLADNFINKEPIADEDVERLRAFANHASLAIESSQLYKSLEEKIEELSSAYHELQENRDKLLRYERLSAVGEVAAKITHEIKNPLVSIGGFARRILKKDQDGVANKNYLKIIVEEIDRLENILTDVLYFAKPAVPQCDTVDLNSIIKNTIEVLSSEIEKNNISVEEHLDPNLPMLWLDEHQIRRVLINLIRNAMQAMPDGGIITVSTINEKQWVIVEITDTGVGISDDDMDKLFDAFFTSKSTGSGLGLTVSAQIINNHGGTIEVHKGKPKGTIFTIKLPA